MEKLKDLLAQECSFRLSDEVMDRLLMAAETVDLKKNEILVMGGKLDPNVYILKEGVIRYTYMNGIKEMVFAFALPGSLMMSMHSYYAHQPAFYQLEACCSSVVLKVSQKDYKALIDSSHEFTKWALCYAQCQLFYLEKKDSVINGDAKERFISLIEKRPEIIEKVPLRSIASYLGITQQYLSLLKNQLKKK